jgi:hypothetical protein
MSNLSIISDVRRCRLGIGFQSLELEAGLFCELNKVIQPAPAGYNRSCTNFAAKPYPFLTVISNLQEAFTQGKAPETVLTMTETEVMAIQKMIVNHYDQPMRCYICHH